MKIDFISENVTCLVNKTNQIELICNASGNPISAMVWIYNGHILASSTNDSNLIANTLPIIDSSNMQNINKINDNERFDKQMQTKFVIENHLRSDSVQIKLIIESCLIGVQHFKCIVFNEFSKDEQSVIVSGHVKPIFAPILLNETRKSVTEGSSIQIDCNAIGYPKPTTIWFKVYVFPLSSH